MVVLVVQPDNENLAVNLLGRGSPWTLDIGVTLFLTAVVELSSISLIRRVLDVEVVVVVQQKGLAPVSRDKLQG